MDAHLPKSPAEIDREISSLISELLEATGIQEARDITLRHYRKWFHLIQGFWLAESRDANAGPAGSVLLNALEPLEMSMMETGNVFRCYNPVLKAVLADPSRGPTSAGELLSRHEWERNPFRAEVVQPLGLIFALSFHIDEGEAAGKHSIFTPILSRDGKDFSADDRAWLARSRVMLEPIFAYIRKREMMQDLRTGSPCVLTKDLSKAEEEVFHWICKGKRNKEIAIILGRSHRTVEKHVQSILAKTGVETRTAVASLWAKRQNIRTNG